MATFITKSELRIDRGARGRKGRAYFFGNTDIEKPAEFKKLLPEVMESIGVSEQLAKTAKFSRYAGCKCGCSPGFIIDGLYNCDLFITTDTI